ncbi:DUF937 domain-containing protein [Sphingobacterium thermophilum]|uniref:DUF937 domain-containing protein n=1 Tax=Sphingobacterium thermophilum TaxID=768534 RepID=A0ABP8QYR1_9SPHI
MESSLLNHVKSYFTEEVINKLGVNLNESPENIKKGIDVSVPAILLGLQSKNKEGLSGILNSAKNMLGNFDFNDVFGNFFGAPSGTDYSKFETQHMLTSIFGERFSSILDSVSSYLGIKGSSAAGLFGASLPAVVAGITHKGTNWNADSISAVLTQNKSSLVAALPSTLGLGAFGSFFAAADEFKSGTSSSVVDKAEATSVPPPHVRERFHEERKSKGGFWWLLIPLILIGAWLLFSKGCQGSGPEEERDAMIQQH